MTILLLGGTAEARDLARRLVEMGLPVLSSLAGRVSAPALPFGPVRIGGFGGTDGLAAFLTRERVRLVVDATHPFAAQMSRHADLATKRTGCPLLRLQRPGWAGHPRAPSWIWVPDVDAARDALEASARPFLTTGRRSLPAFLPLADRNVLVRLVDPPEVDLPASWRLIVARGPYRLAGERMIMTTHQTDALVTKDSGGEHTAAKLDAAADLGVDVVIIERPPAPVGVTTVATVEEAVTWIRTSHP